MDRIHSDYISPRSANEFIAHKRLLLILHFQCFIFFGGDARCALTEHTEQLNTDALRTMHYIGGLSEHLVRIT